MRGLGHEVHLLCQEDGAADLDWVDEVGAWEDGGWQVRRTGVEAVAGSATVYRPDIGGLLPVFVRDRYAGFEVKTFGELSEGELERYIDLNVAAVRAVVERAGDPDAALANHLVMSPVILARAGLRYAVKVHGSDLSYTILPDLERFGAYAREAVAGAEGILVGSRHIADRLREAVNDPETNAKVRLGPPGVDVELFAPAATRSEGTERLRALAGGLRAGTGEGTAAAPPPGSPTLVQFGPDTTTNRTDVPDDAWSRDPAEAAAALEWFADGTGPRVLFVGKLIVSKGVDLLLAAWPLVRARNPEARLLIVGFGAYRDALENLHTALTRGDLATALEIATRGRALESGPAKPLTYLTGFLSDPPPAYAETATQATDTVAFAGRLEHDEVAEVLPACDALVFPSTHPEAFGMVAAEAAAAGVLPVSAAHSGALEVSRALAADLPAEAAGLVSFPVDETAVVAIADRLNGWLDLDESTRQHARSALRGTASKRWGWEGVARSVIAASAGELDELPRADP
jgi:glycosyltransferase involved in cell wall biosynthesis